MSTNVSPSAVAGRPAPGDVLVGKYRVERILGQGGMGIVVQARHLALEEPVAIKVLLPEATKDQDAIARMIREARATVRIKNAHVARVLDVGSLDDGSPYIVMEYLEGHDLGAVLEKVGRLPIPVAVDYVLQACEALAAAHALGIVHRDVKPSNLFVTKTIEGAECVKVLDFGISKATSPLDQSRPDFDLTRTQSVIGTPAYMAPEQMRSSRRADARTDVWGLGALLHELLVGMPPFNAATVPELCAMILQDPAPPILAQRPEIAPELEAVIHRCLEKAPDARYASAGELALALVAFGTSIGQDSVSRIARMPQPVPRQGSDPGILSTLPATPRSFPAAHAPTPLPAPVPVPATSSAQLSHAHTSPTVAREARSRRSRTLAIALVGLAVLLTFVAATGLVVRGWRKGRAVATTGPVDGPAQTAGTAPSPTSEAPTQAGSSAAEPVATASPSPPLPTPSPLLSASAASAASATRHLPTPNPAKPGARPSAAASAAAPAASAPRAPATPPPTATPPGLATSRYD